MSKKTRYNGNVKKIRCINCNDKTTVSESSISVVCSTCTSDLTNNKLSWAKIERLKLEKK